MKPKKVKPVEVIEVSEDELLDTLHKCVTELRCLRSHRTEDRIRHEIDQAVFMLGWKQC